MEVSQGRVPGQRMRGALQAAEAAHGAVRRPIGRPLGLHKQGLHTRYLLSTHPRTHHTAIQGQIGPMAGSAIMDKWGLCVHKSRFATMYAVYPGADFGEEYRLVRGLSMVRQLCIRGMPYMAWLRRVHP